RGGSIAQKALLHAGEQLRVGLPAGQREPDERMLLRESEHQLERAVHLVGLHVPDPQRLELRMPLDHLDQRSPIEAPATQAQLPKTREAQPLDRKVIPEL